jgi:hypothetical protein
MWWMTIGTNCAPLLTDLFIYSYDAHSIQWLLKTNRNKLSRSFTINFIFRFIDDVFLLYNSKFGNFVDPEKGQKCTQRFTQHTYKTCLNPNIAWVTRRDSSLNEYVVRTDHHENINRNESGPTNDSVGYEYSEISVTISKGTNFRGLK